MEALENELGLFESHLKGVANAVFKEGVVLNAQCVQSLMLALANLKDANEIFAAVGLNASTPSEKKGGVAMDIMYECNLYVQSIRLLLDFCNEESFVESNYFKEMLEYLKAAKDELSGVALRISEV